MPSTIYDGVNPATVPAGADVYAGYVNGNWQTYNAFVQQHPNAQHVSISVNSSGTAQVLDVEAGDAAAVDVPGWLNRMRAAGVHRPTVYCSRIGAPGYGWQNVIDACHAAGVALPDFWIADYTSGPHPLSLNGINAVAVQWTDHGGYDESAIYDSTWPGGSNPTPTPPSPTPTNQHILVPGVSVQQVQAKVGVARDGIWGPNTQTAVVTFQQAANITADGIVGNQTWSCMNNVYSLPLIKQGSKGSAVVLAQRLSGVNADGIFGPATAQAIQNVQRSHGIGVDGIVGPQTWGALGI